VLLCSIILVLLYILMMGIEVPETWWAYYKCNKPFSGI